jgi:hypothetical protein
MNTTTHKVSGYNCIAENLKKPTGIFVLKNLLKNNVFPEVIMIGQNIPNYSDQNAKNGDPLY